MIRLPTIALLLAWSACTSQHLGNVPSDPTLDLFPNPNFDLAAPPDSALPPDLTHAVDSSIAADLAISADLSTPADLAAATDLATPSDLAAPPDLTNCALAFSWTTAPPTLSATGLYANLASDTTAVGVQPFHPAYELWADGASKRRWVSLPPCGQIDSSNMDHWVLPAGARFWKEFTVGGIRVETRLIARVASGAFVLAAYQWRADGSDADYVPNGAPSASGTTHDIPSATDCLACHAKQAERILGFSAIQLSHDGNGVTIDTLAQAGALTLAPPAGGYPVPGNPVEQAALGYLHGNCGHCHDAGGVALAHPFLLRLSVADRTPAATTTYRTAVNIPTDGFHLGGVTTRVAPMNVSASCVPYRMGQRMNSSQMPPLATKLVDNNGLAAITSWIDSLPAY